MAAHLRLRGGRPQEAPKPPPLRLVNSDKVLSYVCRFVSKRERDTSVDPNNLSVEDELSFVLICGCGNVRTLCGLLGKTKTLWGLWKK